MAVLNNLYEHQHAQNVLPDLHALQTLPLLLWYWEQKPAT